MDITSDDRLGEDEWRRFETQLLSAIGRNVPKWTDRQDGDPGVAIVELFAFLAEQLIYRAGTIPDRSRARLFEVADKLESLPGTVDVRAATVCIEGDQWQQTASLANAGPTITSSFLPTRGVSRSGMASTANSLPWEVTYSCRIAWVEGRTEICACRSRVAGR
jgi:hypothetical protein